MWKNIKGYEGLYQISDTGEVKSLQRHVENGSKRGMILKERILKPCISKNGYPYVVLRKDGKSKNLYLHRLVALHFLEETSVVVNHKDGNKRNNSVSNLEFVSYSENNQHAYDNNLHHKGELHYKSKLTASQAKEIKENGKYDTYKNISDKYGVSAATVRDVLVGNTWR